MHGLSVQDSPLSGKKACGVLLFAFFALFVLVDPAWAVKANDFEPLWTMLSEWCSGTLGKVISLSFLLVGLGIGVVRGSIIGAISCIAAAAALLMAPTLIDGMFG